MIEVINGTSLLLSSRSWMALFDLGSQLFSPTFFMSGVLMSNIRASQLVTGRMEKHLRTVK